MTLRLGQTAPDFEQDTANGSIRFHEWLGASWCMLFSHPQNFTPVSATELAAVARLAPEWARRGVKVVGLSADTAEGHIAWLADVEDAQSCTVGFPVIADCDRTVSALYGLADGATIVPAIFVIDPAKIVRLIMAYPACTGRNFVEILRAIDSLQLADAHAVATPAGWVAGQDVFIAPALSDAEAAARFAGGWTGPKPYLRVVPQPMHDPDQRVTP
jgi:alkyl hydroperoxide reductase subunit AhpC